MRGKHRNDQNHGKNGYIGGNPRTGKSRGNFKGERANEKEQTAGEIARETTPEPKTMQHHCKS